MENPNIKSGFTLVELSIVLVIIGMLIGGILVGQSLVNSAKINKQVQQIQQINIAVSQFKNKFKDLPGDSNKFGTTSGVSTSGQPSKICAGNGDGMIGGYISNTVADGNTSYSNWSGTNCGVHNFEYLRVFEHLQATGFYLWKFYDDSVVAIVNLPDTGYPKMILDSYAPKSLGYFGGLVVAYEPALSYIKGGHKIRLGACPGLSTGPTAAGTSFLSFFCSPNLLDMQALDNKLDDGKPYSGDTVITSDYYIYRVPGGLVYDATTCCGTSATNTYKTTATGTEYVGLEVYMGF